jgi:hypothetical protein
MYNNKHYQVVADGLRSARDAVNASFKEGTASHAAAMAAWETTAERVMATLRAHHHGAHPFSDSRFEKAAGL